MKKGLNVILVFIMIFTSLGMTKLVFSDTVEIIGSYNVIGLENMDYELDVKAITRSTEFFMDDEKLSFYMLGCDLVEKDEGYYKFIIRNNEYGAKFVFIAPEAGRDSGEFSTADFYPDRNSIMRVKDVDYITYRLVDGTWLVEIGDEVLDPTITYVETGVDGDKLVTESTGGEEGNFVLNLDNYSLSKENAEFVFFHGFDHGSVMDAVMDDSGITFRSKEVMFRTFESRLQSDATLGVIYTDRTPSDAMIGQTIRFTGNSDDGDNLAVIQSVDSENHKIYIDRVNGLSYNEHDEGTWVRCYNDYSNGQVVPNIYPKISVSPSFWTIQESEFQSLMDTITNADPTGLLDGVDVELDTNDSFGYSLRNVTYSSDGLNFTGGLNGAFYIGFEFYFFGRDVSIDPIRVDYGSVGTALTDQILRINTYKSEAIRFNFNPDEFGGYAQFSDMGSFNPPDTFPLRFRIYFDKNLEVIGGNVRINLPGKGIPLPGGMIYIDNIGGGYRIPHTYEVSAQFTSYEVLGFPLWQAEAEMELSIDQKYLEIEGSSWIFGKKIQIGDFDALVAWSYYTGKQFKGVEVSGEIGVHKASVDLIVDITFKVKRYKSDGTTKTYVGGRGRASIEAFGYTFGGVSVSANTSRFKASVKVPIIGYKSVYVKYSDVTRNISSLSPPISGLDEESFRIDPQVQGVASYTDGLGNQIILVPEATRLGQVPFPEDELNTITLVDSIVEGAIVVDYSGTLDQVSVTLPNGTTKEVIIADDTMTYDSNYLYAMDYEISDTTRQLYIQLETPLVGDYEVHTGTTVVNEINLYEITQFPNAENFDVTVVGDVASLYWDVSEDVENTKYHLTLQRVNDDLEVMDEYLLYEDYVDELEQVYEVYVPDQAISELASSRQMDLLLPESLPDGQYRFVLEPVLVDVIDDNFPGETVYSSVFVMDSVEGVAATTSMTSDYIGNGLTEVSFDHVSDATGYEVVLKDVSGTVIDTLSMSTIDLFASGFINGGTVSFTISLDQEAGADYYLSNVVYDETYSYSIISLKEETKTVEDEYDSINGYLVIENIILNQDQSITYRTESSSASIVFEEYSKIAVSANLESDTYTTDTGVVNEDPVLETEYVYDEEDDSVDIEYFTMRVPEEVYNMPGLSVVEFIPDQDIEQFAFVLISPQGEVLFEMPLVDLSLYQDHATYLAFYSQLMTMSAQFTQSEINLLVQLFNDDVFSFDGSKVSVNIDALYDGGLIDDFIDGVYTIHLDLYNANGDYSPIDFSVRIADFIPGVFIESIRKEGDQFYVNGLVNGATSLTLNDVNATITDGYFEAVIEMVDATIVYELETLFHTQFTGSITIQDDLNHPTIELSSTEDIIVTEGGYHALPTCVANDVETLDLECVMVFDNEFIGEPGEYWITYYAMDEYGNKSEEIQIRLIVLEDVTSPVITLSSYDDITIDVGDEYTLPTCTVEDDGQVGLLCDITYSPELGDEAGTYVISYSATDLNGNTSEVVNIILTINEQLIDPIDTCPDGYQLDGTQCVPEPSSSNVGLLIGLVTGGVIVVGGGIVLFYIKRIRI